uniref:AC4 n=2 Tax=Begomovirus TaxID=10814 RepID=S5G5E2_9GEMI|nr:C4 protein [Tomato yellow leaf curl virus]AML61061.1 C4 [Tomato leaf curl Sudan virus]ALN12565.1 c4 protein [Tomato yellow leaf curl virus]ALN12573.1 c4 protein [Tomato yellow leaf curl virus]ALN12579.1 c4 protein [Tomato yellow leaf curl virus]
MGNRISTCLCNSKESTSAQINDSSTWSPQPGQHISIQTFRELNPALTSSHILTRTETPSNGVSFRSMEGPLEGDNNQQMMLTPRRLTLEVSRRLLM